MMHILWGLVVPPLPAPAPPAVWASPNLPSTPPQAPGFLWSLPGTLGTLTYITCHPTVTGCRWQGPAPHGGLLSDWHCCVLAGSRPPRLEIKHTVNFHHFSTGRDPVNLYSNQNQLLRSNSVLELTDANWRFDAAFWQQGKLTEKLLCLPMA